MHILSVSLASSLFILASLILLYSLPLRTRKSSPSFWPCIYFSSLYSSTLHRLFLSLYSYSYLSLFSFFIHLSHKIIVIPNPKVYASIRPALSIALSLAEPCCVASPGVTSHCATMPYRCCAMLYMLNAAAPRAPLKLFLYIYLSLEAHREQSIHSRYQNA